jgi:hypothetical protein
VAASPEKWTPRSINYLLYLTTVMGADQFQQGHVVHNVARLVDRVGGDPRKFRTIVRQGDVQDSRSRVPGPAPMDAGVVRAAVWRDRRLAVYVHSQKEALKAAGNSFSRSTVGPARQAT